MQNQWIPRIILFHDHPEFTPNLTPADIFQQGAFGGTYWRPIQSGVTKQKHENEWAEIPSLQELFVRDPSIRQWIDSSVFDVRYNKYGVKAGSDLDDWESKSWIAAQDPYGWVQWYCRFYHGRRTIDDARQIDRWLKFAGPKGRFRRNLINQVLKAGVRYDDLSISPVIRQGLHQWGYCLIPDHAVP